MHVNDQGKKVDLPHDARPGNEKSWGPFFARPCGDPARKRYSIDWEATPYLVGLEQGWAEQIVRLLNRASEHAYRQGVADVTATLRNSAKQREKRLRKRLGLDISFPQMPETKKLGDP